MVDPKFTPLVPNHNSLPGQTNNLPHLRFAVVGGGISGLTAAYRLTQRFPAAQVDLFEAADRLGGVLSTLTVDNLLVERGADSFLAQQPWALELCQELGLDEELIPTNPTHRRALVLWGGELLPVPAGFYMIRPQKMLPILRSDLLSWPGKLRLLAERWVPRPVNIEQPDYDESLANFATARLGKEAFTRLVEPLLAGIYTADAKLLSVAATMPDALTAVRERGTLWERKRNNDSVADGISGARYGSFVTLRKGMNQLVDTLRSRLAPQSVYLNQAARHLARYDQSTWHLQLADGTSRGPYQGVVAALPALQTAKLIESEVPLLASLLRRIPYASSAIVCFAFRLEQLANPPKAFGIVVPAAENSQIVAVSFSSVKFPGRSPTDQIVVRVFLGGALRPELVELPDEQMQALALRELSPLVRVDGAPLFAEVVRWREKMPQYHVGHVQLVNEIEAVTRQIQGLALAGNAYRGVGIPHCVRSGNEAALKVAACVENSRTSRL